jgi:uncharacterized protein (DUF58 family)
MNPSEQKELFKRIRHIEIRAKKLADELLAGEYVSAFKGHGIEFAEVREYVHGDDVRLIDWNVTARMGIPYIKRYVEERELNVFLVVDVSGSMTDKFATEVELCALIAISAIKGGDRVGMIAFTDELELFIPPRKGRSHALRVIRDLILIRPERRKTDLNPPLELLGKTVKRRCIAFLISDFFCGDFTRSLRLASKRHDLIAIALNSPSELKPPKCGLVMMSDPESGREVMVDLSGRYLESVRGKIEGFRRWRREIFRRCEVDHVEITAGKPYVEPLARLFRSRAQRRWR